MTVRNSLHSLIKTPTTYVEAARNIGYYALFHSVTMGALSIGAAITAKIIKNPQWIAPLAARVQAWSAVSITNGALLFVIFMSSAHKLFLSRTEPQNRRAFLPAGFAGAGLLLLGATGCIAKMTTRIAVRFFHRGHEWDALTSRYSLTSSSVALTSFWFLAFIAWNLSCVELTKSKANYRERTKRLDSE